MTPPRQPIQPARQSDFGLLAWLEQTRVALPLKGVECRFQINGSIASVELDQVFHQNADRPLDCAYTFPLPAGAAVYRCEVHINGRVIRAKVEEEEAAKEIYRTQKAAGRRAALVETERPNLFTLSLGNVQPGDVIVVCFAWFQALDRAGDGLRLLVPTCPGVRYIPGKPLLRGLSGRGTADDTDQVPDASRITPPRIDALHPDAAYFSITGRLSASDVETGTASSPSHPVLVREGDGTVAVELSGRDAVPDRDFVLSWKEPKVLQLASQAWRWKDGRDTYALVQLRAPEHVKVAGELEQDFYFLVDRSGSMEGAKWRRTCEALRSFVALLGTQDRVWITLFESGFRDFDAVPVPAPGILADEAFQRLEEIGATGGTELLPAASHVLEKIAVHSAGRHTNVVLITDGEVGNEEAILRAFSSAADVAVHTFGIDTAVNDAFLKSLARRHRGGCWLQTPDDDIAGTVAALGDRLKRPVLSNVTIEGSWETSDGTLPDLHAREVVTVALRGNAEGPITVTGCLPDGTPHAFTVMLGSEGSEAVKLLWAQQRIEALLASGRKHEAITLAKVHNLICEGAAFIAWDEQEQVAIAKDELVQPAILASGSRRSMCLFAGGWGGDAKISRDRVFSSDDTRLLEPASQMQSEPLQEEAERKARFDEKIRQLRYTCQHCNVPDSVAEGFIAWAKDGGDETRASELNHAMDFLWAIPFIYFSPALNEAVQHVLRGSPEAIVKWEQKNRPALDFLERLLGELRDVETFPDTIERLVTWILESGSLNMDRLNEISRVVEALRQEPRSISKTEREWRQLLAGTA